MADVVQKVITGNNIVQGSAVVGVDKTGHIESLAPTITSAISITAVENKYTNRFDDVNYYTHSG